MCQFIAAPKSLEGNPCPDVRRLISFAYKCRPCKFSFRSFRLSVVGTRIIETLSHSFVDEFRSKIACENEIIQLTCSPYWRITIYSASYGRTEYESVQCAQPQGVLEESKSSNLFVVIQSQCETYDELT